jgi:hypothetical protein
MKDIRFRWRKLIEKENEGAAQEALIVYGWRPYMYKNDDAPSMQKRYMLRLDLVIGIVYFYWLGKFKEIKP